MLNQLKRNFWLILIFLLALFLRVWRLGEVPPSLTWDEAALGYNAFSIFETGRDEYGKFLPLILKSFGDYKPVLYVYLTVPFVWLLGLTEMAVRLPSAILGSLGVLGVYLLVKELFSGPSTSPIPQPRQFPNPSGLGSLTRRVFPWRGFSLARFPLLAALLLTISPWHINFSRGAWEANVALFFILVGVYMFLKSLKEPKLLYFLLFTFSFLFSLYTYQGAKLFVPLLILGTIVIYRKELLKINRKWLLVTCLSFVLALPIYISALGKSGGRLRVMSVFTFPRPESEIEEVLQQDEISRNSPVFKIFHSETLNFSRGILGRYFNHFSGRFLFFEGDWQNPRLGVPYMGMLYFIDLFLILVGLIFLAKEKGKGKYLVLWWLFIAPIPAAFSRDAVSSVRTLPMVVPLTILIALGILGLLGDLGDKRKRALVVLLLIVIYSWYLVYYLDQYYVHRAKRYSQTMQFGYKEVVNFVTQNFHKNYERIIFTQKYGQPYIYWLFYTQYDPARYQRQARLIESPVGDVGKVERIDDVEFREIYWPGDRGLKNSLFIGTEWELPLKDIESAQAEILKEVYFLNSQLAFRVVGTL